MAHAAAPIARGQTQAAGRLDAELYSHFRKEFPDLQVGMIDEETLKAKDQQAKWREFCEKYRDTIKDYNFGTLLRLDSKGDYTPENTTFGTRWRGMVRRWGEHH